MSFPDPEYMREALRLARKGVGRTSPNPAVGAVVVRNGRVAGTGWHRAAGLPHAEIEALRAAGARARGADLYVTLEPCAHTGRTGPCTEAIVAAGIRRVAAAMEDPNPRVAGKGFAALRRAGVVVETGLLADGALALNRPYCRWIVTGTPFVTLKLAMSLDGRIAGASGASRWVSGERSRAAVHRMRAESDAVLVGGRTFRVDDPLLTSRARGAKEPRRVVLTSDLSRLSGRRLFGGGGGEVILACPATVPRVEIERARALGARVIPLPARGGRVRARDLLTALGSEGISSLLVEGGAATAGWLVAEGAVDRFVFFVAPLLLGDAVGALSGWGARSPAQGKRLRIVSAARCGGDLVIVADRG